MPKPTSPDGPIAALHRAIAGLEDGGGSRPPAGVKTEHVHPTDEPLAEADAGSTGPGEEGPGEARRGPAPPNGSTATSNGSV